MAEDIDSAWHHLAVVFGVTQALFYLDGVEKFRDKIILGRSPKYDGYKPELFAIGVSPTLRKFFFKGEIDNVGIWGRQLSQAEVEQVRAIR